MNYFFPFHSQYRTNSTLNWKFYSPHGDQKLKKYPSQRQKLQPFEVQDNKNGAQSTTPHTTTDGLRNEIIIYYVYKRRFSISVWRGPVSTICANFHSKRIKTDREIHNHLKCKFPYRGQYCKTEFATRHKVSLARESVILSPPKRSNRSYQYHWNPN